MDLIDFKNEILSHYVDEEYQVTIDRNPTKWSSGNGLLHTGIFYTILGINNLLDYNDRRRFQRAVDLCWVRDRDSQPIYGLLNRNFGREDKQAHDDYIGVVAGGVFTGTDVCRFIYEYGNRNLYSYDNTHPYNKNIFSKDFWTSFQGRFPGLIGFYKISADKYIGFFDSKSIELKFKFQNIDDASGTIMAWLTAKAIKQKTSRFNQVIDSWEKRVSDKYGILGNLFRPYFGDRHVFSQLKGVI